ncbi:unnamed protein product [Lupinus luteus]|uniref:Bifunctional inhibitor/plant lipid transfer protein/seed storage helical domain-containing protein n=1 Tax=Lupinus luteus TaxID=3873 RepID=A0AAV1Y3V7_LUPLU
MHRPLKKLNNVPYLINYNLISTHHTTTMKMAYMPHFVVLAMVLLLISDVMGDSVEEKKKCAEQLTNIATCLPYVGGVVKAPTPDCCSGLKQAIINNKKCICLIIKDRDDPDLALKINITVALGLPSICKAPDNFSQCPALLHLDPKSAEAQAFNQLGQNSNGGSPSPSPTPSAEGNSQNGKPSKTGIAKSDASYKGKRLLESLVAGLVIWFF